MRYLILLLFLFGCDEATKEDFDRTGRPQKITVFVHKDEADLTKALQEKTGKTQMEHLGWAEWSLDEEWGCEIHVVKRDQSTWGHELKHCMYGNYHN